LGGVFDLEAKQTKLDQINKQLENSKIWNDHLQAKELLKQKKQLEDSLNKIKDILAKKEELLLWWELAKDGEAEGLSEVKDLLDVLSSRLAQLEVEFLLGEPEDEAEAILEIHPGAGGIEAQDWAEMLLRMYLRWAEQRGFKVEYLDYLSGDEAGIKSVTLHVKGDYSYGLLKGEKGTHRLIRISPFDTSKRRHTSFASIDVYPYESSEVQIELKEDDLEIEAFRAGGPGGQHVNKTSSAIRIVHKPTGIVVQCQNERSQFKNKEIALKILKAKLLQRELNQRQAQKQKEYETKGLISFGHQIRTYTLHPYQMVKDHRTNYETSNVAEVLDGNLDSLIKEYLIYLKQMED